MIGSTKEVELKVNSPSVVWGAVVGSSSVAVSVFAIAAHAVDVEWPFWATIGTGGFGLAASCIWRLLTDAYVEADGDEGSVS